MHSDETFINHLFLPMLAAEAVATMTRLGGELSKSGLERGMTRPNSVLQKGLETAWSS